MLFILLIVSIITLLALLLVSEKHMNKYLNRLGVVAGVGLLFSLLGMFIFVIGLMPGGTVKEVNQKELVAIPDEDGSYLLFRDKVYTYAVVGENNVATIENRHSKNVEVGYILDGTEPAYVVDVRTHYSAWTYFPWAVDITSELEPKRAIYLPYGENIPGL